MSVPISSFLRNHVKEKLARNEVVASMSVRLVRSIEIARASGQGSQTDIDLRDRGRQNARSRERRRGVGVAV